MNRSVKRTLIGLGTAAVLSMPTLASSPYVAASAGPRCFDPTTVGAAARGASNPRSGDTRSVSRSRQKTIESRTNRLAAGRRARSRITVPVYVHDMESSTGAGDVSHDRIVQQIEVLNQTYSGQDADHPGSPDSGFRFTLAGTDRFRNSTWHTDGDSETYRARTRKGGRDALNIWLVDFDALGIATFPWEDASAGDVDGIRVEFKSLPGGSATHYDAGKTVTHETGHWLGLYHTFQDGCAVPGDEVSDTAAQASPSTGCPVGRNSCSGPGLDPIHNYMDYSYDSCYQGFTAGQVERMKKMWTAYRG